MPTKKWTDEEEEFLKENYMNLSNADLADKFDITKNAIQKKLARMGLKRSETSDDFIEDEDEEEDEDGDEAQALDVMESHFYQGNKFYFEEQNYTQAVDEYRKAVQDDNDELIKLKAMYWLAESYVKLQKIDEARATFKSLADEYGRHYLGSSARRRFKELEEYVVPSI